MRAISIFLSANSFLSIVVVGIVLLVVVSVPVQLLLVRQELVREGLTEVIDFVAAAAEFAVRQFHQAAWSYVVLVPIAVLVRMRILELDLAHFLPHLFQNFWLGLA